MADRSAGLVALEPLAACGLLVGGPVAGSGVSFVGRRKLDQSNLPLGILSEYRLPVTDYRLHFLLRRPLVLVQQHLPNVLLANRLEENLADVVTERCA